MSQQRDSIPDSTAVRVALWRALHLEVDASPPILEDEIGLRLAAPPEDWRQRPDMHPEGTKGYRASIVGRSRFIEDLVLEQLKCGVDQYIILGAGLDTFAQRRTSSATQLQIFEVDKPQTQEWKRKRLEELGFGTPSNLHLAPVDFESGESWREKIVAVGFAAKRPAILASTGVSMYLTRKANQASLREIASLAPGSILALSFLLPLELIEASERDQHKMVYERARAAGTPFISFFSPDEIQALASAAGFRKLQHISRADLIQRYFHQRSDGLAPASGEELLLATV